MTDPELDDLCINTIRTLSMDAVQKANSGHPGMPMGAATMTYVLWDRFLKHNPADPKWPDRDRFVLSAGHASMLLYSMLHLTGYPGITLDDIKHFRQWGSPTAGHPEYGLIPGIEVTTGPLGQGFANSVGMAMAERYLAASFNRPGHDDRRPLHVRDRQRRRHDGGHLARGGVARRASAARQADLPLRREPGLARRPDVARRSREDVGSRFEAYGWQVQRIDGMDCAAQVDTALRLAQQDAERPSLIVAHTHIGYGSPNKQDTSKAHGSPLGDDEVAAAKRFYGWPADKTFYVPGRSARRTSARRSHAARRLQSAWDEQMAGVCECAYPDAGGRITRGVRRRPAFGLGCVVAAYTPADKAIATRVASGQALNAIAGRLPLLIGGSADLGGSNDTDMKGLGVMTAETPAGRNIYFGVREHGMMAAVNGMAAHGGVLPFGATFLTFSDYCRPSIRLAALSDYHSDLRLHARQHRPWRRRPDAPADRAPDGAAGDPGAHGHPPGRRQRDVDGMEGRGRAPRPDAARAFAAVAAATAGHGRWRCAGAPARRLRRERGAGQRRAGRHHHRYRLGSEHRRGGAGDAARSAASGRAL